MDVAHHSDNLPPRGVDRIAGRDPPAESCGGRSPVFLGEVLRDHDHSSPIVDIRPVNGAPREERVLHGFEVALRDPLEPPQGKQLVRWGGSVLDEHRVVGIHAVHGQGARCAYRGDAGNFPDAAPDVLPCQGDVRALSYFSCGDREAEGQDLLGVRESRVHVP